MRCRPRFALVVFAVLLAGCGTVSLPSTTTPAATPTEAVPTVTGDPGVPGGTPSWNATVTRVVDGDTVEVRYANGTTDTVRLVGVDTPETRGGTTPDEFEGVPDTEAGRACLADAADRASAALESWVANASVTLVADPSEGPRDRYDRLLAYLVRDGTNVNYRLVATGQARVYDTQFALADAFDAAEDGAQREAAGVWQCGDPAARNATDGLGVRVVADAPGDDTQNLNGEYVVVSNPTNESRDVGGWTVGDEADHTYTFPRDATVPANGSVRLYTGSGTDTATEFYWGSRGAVWNNDGDTVTVRNRGGTVVVQRSY